MDAAVVRALAGALAGTAPLWRPAPFHDDPPWVTDTPALAGVLLSLDEKSVTALEAAPGELQAWVGKQVPALATLFAAAEACVDAQPPPQPLDEPETAGRDVPGRKWQQLLHYAAACALPGDALAASRVEWCSGKGHLARLLARRHGARVTAIEWDASLCDDGARLAVRDGVAVAFRHADALRITAADAGLAPDTHAHALHACGDLHVALLVKAGTAGVAAIDVAPCCYHLTGDAHWQPLSAALAGCALTQLPLTREDLRLAVQETVTSGARVIRQQREMAVWRLGFDRLQRELRGVDAYLPTPSRPARVLADGFAAFCRDMTRHHRLALPDNIDADHYLGAGRQRLARVRRLELVRHACRRPLETLLVADRALFLAGHGYDVHVRVFCPRPLTPRNLLIQARLRARQHRPAGQPEGMGAD